MKRYLLISLIVLLLPLTVFAQGDGEDEANFLVSPDGSFAAILPQGWVGDFDAETATFASSEEALEIATATEDIPVLPSGDIAISVTAIPTEFIGLFEEDADVSLTEIINVFLEVLAAEEEDFPELSPAEEIEFAPGQIAAVVRGSQDGAEFALLTYMIAPDTIAITAVVGVEGELFAAEADVLALLEGILYSAPLDETYEDDTVTINYPVGWEAANVQPGIYTFTNVPEKLELGEEGGPLESGEYVMAIYNLNETGEPEGELPDLLVAVGEQLLDEDEEDSFTEPVQIPLEERELYGMTVIQADEEENGGGILITRATTGEILIVVYATALGEETLGSWTAANMLLGVDIKH